MKSKVVNLANKLDQFQEHWSPKIVGELNGQQVKLAKLKGEFVMHKHDVEDELFYVIDGVLKIEFQEETKTILPGEFIIIPAGVLHKPIAEKEVSIMLFEPASTVNTGNITNEKTVVNLDHLTE